jgi:hypothetical protein
MFGSCPSLALPNVGKNWLAKILAKKSSAHTRPNIWQESVRDGGMSIDSQNFGNKPSIDQNTLGNQFFGKASVGN